MKTLQQIAKENGFQYRKVSAEEREDGVGVVVGDNWIAPLKSGHKLPEWYTTSEMIEELGLPKLQVKAENLDASVGIEGAKGLAIEWLKEQGATWYYFERCKFGFGGSAVCVSVHYGI